MRLTEDRSGVVDALGSEIVMEVSAAGYQALRSLKCYLEKVWKQRDERFVRIMHEGLPVPTLDRIPLDVFIKKLEDQVPENLFEKCTS